jgi:hypothetical protein
MRRVFINKWFILASLLTISLSAFSFVAFQDVQKNSLCQQCRKPAGNTEKSDLLWDLIANQLTNVSFQ